MKDSLKISIFFTVFGIGFLLFSALLPEAIWTLTGLGSGHYKGEPMDWPMAVFVLLHWLVVLATICGYVLFHRAKVE